MVEREELVRRIRTAFSSVRHPGDSRVLSDDCYDIDELRDFLGKDWNSDWRLVPYEVLDRNVVSIPFFSPRAFQFYLPAFMEAVLSRSNLTLLASLVSPLVPYDDPELTARTERKLRELSREQLETVLDFLKLIRPELEYPGWCDNEADEAIKFCAKLLRDEADLP